MGCWCWTWRGPILLGALFLLAVVAMLLASRRNCEAHAGVGLLGSENNTSTAAEATEDKCDGSRMKSNGRLQEYDRGGDMNDSVQAPSVMAQLSKGPVLGQSPPNPVSTSVINHFHAPHHEAVDVSDPAPPGLHRRRQSRKILALTHRRNLRQVEAGSHSEEK